MTEKFQVSEKFDWRVRLVIEEAVRRSWLPEGVRVVRNCELNELSELEGDGPIVVLSVAPHWQEAARAYRDRRVIKYRPLSCGVEQLVKRLSE